MVYWYCWSYFINHFWNLGFATVLNLCIVVNLKFALFYHKVSIVLRANVNMHQTNSGKSSKICFLTNFHILQHNPLFYHLNLIPCHYWSWQRNIYFLVNIFVQHTFSMWKSSIKTKTNLAMTDMTESIELLAFKRQKDGYKVTIKITNLGNLPKYFKFVQWMLTSSLKLIASISS